MESNLEVNQSYLYDFFLSFLSEKFTDVLFRSFSVKNPLRIRVL